MIGPLIGDTLVFNYEKDSWTETEARKLLLWDRAEVPNSRFLLEGVAYMSFGTREQVYIL